MILLTVELWLLANNSKNFGNTSKSIIKNNLGLCKNSEIYLIYNFQKHCYGSNGKEIEFNSQIHCIQFNSLFLIPNFGLGENVTIYGIDNSSSTHADYTKKNSW